MKIICLAALILLVSGCGSASNQPEPAEHPKPVEQAEPTDATDAADATDSPDSTEASSYKAQMTDVPGDKSAKIVPQCEDANGCNAMGAFAIMSGKRVVGMALLKKACDLGSKAACENLKKVEADTSPSEDDEQDVAEESAE